MQNTFLSSVDYIVIAVYVVGVTVLGALFCRSQKNTEDFFLAGRSMSWFPVAISIIATNVSAISYMGTPGFIYKTGLQVTMVAMISIPISVPFVIFLFLRFFHRLKLYTAYEYLEKRFNVGIRTVGSTLFILLRLCWLATVIYVPSLALSVVTRIPLITWILAVGLFSTFYTTLGGMKAVIWTDVAQFFVMVGSMVAMVIVLLISFNWNPGQIWNIAVEGGRGTLFDFSFDMTKNLSFWGIILGYMFINVASYGVDQVILQRSLTTKTLKAAEKSMLYQAVMTIPIVMFLACLGIGFFAFYQVHPELLPANFKPDQVLPIFVVQQLPIGISGLVIAGIFAATMSSADSGINSLTTCTVVDFYQRFLGGDKSSDHHRLVVARIGTVFWGLVATALAVYINRLGTILEISVKTNGFFCGVLLGIFLMGTVLKRVNTGGAIIGGVLGMAGVVLIGIYTPISYWWYSPIGCCLTMGIGYISSFFFPRPEEEKLRGLIMRSPGIST